MSLRCKLGIHNRDDWRFAPVEYHPNGKRKIKPMEVYCSRCGVRHK